MHWVDSARSSRAASHGLYRRINPLSTKLDHCSASRDATVSIHAPARGATDEEAPGFLLEESFNPRPRTGGD